MSNLMSDSAKVLMVSLAYLLGKLVIGGLIYGLSGLTTEDAPGLNELIPPMFAASVLSVLVLIYPVRASVLEGRMLFLATFLALFGIGVFLVQIEALVFLDIGIEVILAGTVAMTLNYLLLAFLVIRYFHPGSEAGQGTQVLPTEVPWLRMAMVPLAYVLVYILAGMMIWPKVQAFYETQHIPSLGLFLPLQWVRGALYIAFAWMLLRSLAGSRMQVAISMALLFPVFAGVASLLAPNAYMPDTVRYWHLVEIAWSNVVYGFLVGLICWRARQD